MGSKDGIMMVYLGILLSGSIAFDMLFITMLYHLTWYGRTTFLISAFLDIFSLVHFILFKR